MNSTRVVALVITCGFAIFPRAALSQEGAQTISLSLDEAIELAESLAPRLSEFRALVAVAEAGVQNAKAGRMPTLDSSARYSRWNNVPEWTILQDGVPTVIYPNLPNNLLLELAGSVPLYTGGRVEAGIAAAERNLAASSHDVESETANLRFLVTTTYWELAQTKEVADALTIEDGASGGRPSATRAASSRTSPTG